MDLYKDPGDHLKQCLLFCNSLLARRAYICYSECGASSSRLLLILEKKRNSATRSTSLRHFILLQKRGKKRSLLSRQKMMMMLKFFLASAVLLIVLIFGAIFLERENAIKKIIFCSACGDPIRGNIYYKEIPSGDLICGVCMRSAFR